MNKWVAGGLLLVAGAAIIGLQHLVSNAANRQRHAIAPLFPPIDPATQLAAGEWHRLFDGMTLDGWDHVGGGKVSVQDGVLILESDDERRPGYLVSRCSARNFQARWQCQVVTGDSGLFYRCHRDPRTPATILGPQVQLNFLPDRGLGGIYETQGRGWLCKPPPATNPLLHDANDVSCALEVRDDHVRVTVNGMVTADFTDDDSNPFRAAGFFALQIHGGSVCRVLWRSLEVRILE